jgi:hypothetical protein
MLSKFIIRDYLKDMLIYLSSDSDTIRTSKLFQRSIENNWGKTFGLVWKKFYLKPEHELVVFNKAIIFGSYFHNISIIFLARQSCDDVKISQNALEKLASPTLSLYLFLHMRSITLYDLKIIALLKTTNSCSGFK